MTRHTWIWLLTCAFVLVSAASCYPPPLVPAGETGVPAATAHATVQSLPAEGAAEFVTATPPAETATPIASMAPTIAITATKLTILTVLFILLLHDMGISSCIEASPR